MTCEIQIIRATVASENKNELLFYKVPVAFIVRISECHLGIGLIVIA